jgi:hypothetical protein
VWGGGASGARPGFYRGSGFFTPPLPVFTQNVGWTCHNPELLSWYFAMQLLPDNLLRSAILLLAVSLKEPLELLT